MSKYIVVGAVALALVSGPVLAQSGLSPSGTTPIVAPPIGTLSSSRTERTIDSNGTETDSSRTTYRNEAGVADDVHTTTTTHPAVRTTTSSISTTTTTH
jgi:hypothetical protein